jgi:hypothetical protein
VTRRRKWFSQTSNRRSRAERTDRCAGNELPAGSSDLWAQLSSPAADLNPMNLDGNQASIREVCDAGLLAGAVTMV